MKKLLLFTILCVGIFTQAAVKSDLVSAILFLDINATKEIVETEKFTQREYDRYLALAEEVVRNREALYLNMYTTDDVSIIDEGPSIEQVVSESFTAYSLFALSKIFSIYPEKGMSKKSNNAVVILSGVAASILVCKAIFDFFNMRLMWCKHKLALRKKYVEAVLIKQLIYMANVVDA